MDKPSGTNRPPETLHIGVGTIEQLTRVVALLGHHRGPSKAQLTLEGEIVPVSNVTITRHLLQVLTGLGAIVRVGPQTDLGLSRARKGSAGPKTSGLVSAGEKGGGAANTAARPSARSRPGMHHIWTNHSVEAARTYSFTGIANECLKIRGLSEGRKKRLYSARMRLREFRNAEVIDDAEERQLEDELLDAGRAVADAQDDDYLTDAKIGAVFASAVRAVADHKAPEPKDSAKWAKKAEHTAHNDGVAWAQALRACGWDSGRASDVLVGEAIIGVMVDGETVREGALLSSWKLANVAQVSETQAWRALGHFRHGGFLRPATDEHDKELASARNTRKVAHLARRYETTFPHGWSRNMETLKLSQVATCRDFLFADDRAVFLTLVSVFGPKRLDLLPRLPEPGDWWSHTSLGVSRDALRIMVAPVWLPGTTMADRASGEAPSCALVEQDPGTKRYRTCYRIDDLAGLPIVEAAAAQRVAMAKVRQHKQAQKKQLHDDLQERRREDWKEAAQALVERYLALARQGLFPIPLEEPRVLTTRPRADNGKRPPKHSHGEHEASQDQSEFRRWAHRWTWGNIGIATGPSMKDVLDIDLAVPDGNGGWVKGFVETDASAVWEAARAGWGLTSKSDYLVSSPTGGVHVYFEARDDVRLMATRGDTVGRGGACLPPLYVDLHGAGPVRLSLDTRGDTGYVVAPGSRVNRPDPTRNGEVVWRSYEVFRDGQPGRLTDEDLRKLKTVRLEPKVEAETAVPEAPPRALQALDILIPDISRPADEYPEAVGQ